MSTLVLIVEKGKEGDKCDGLGYFREGDGPNNAYLAIASIDPDTMQTTYRKVPVVVVQKQDTENEQKGS